MIDNIVEHIKIKKSCCCKYQDQQKPGCWEIKKYPFSVSELRNTKSSLSTERVELALRLDNTTTAANPRWGLWQNNLVALRRQ